MKAQSGDEEQPVQERATAEVLTLAQLADYLQITESTLYKLVQAGRVPAKKVGRQWRFQRNAIDKWLAEGSRTTPAKRKR